MPWLRAGVVGLLIALLASVGATAQSRPRTGIPPIPLAEMPPERPASPVDWLARLQAWAAAVRSHRPGEEDPAMYAAASITRPDLLSIRDDLQALGERLVRARASGARVISYRGDRAISVSLLDDLVRPRCLGGFRDAPESLRAARGAAPLRRRRLRSAGTRGQRRWRRVDADQRRTAGRLQLLGSPLGVRATPARPRSAAGRCGSGSQGLVPGRRPSDASRTLAWLQRAALDARCGPLPRRGGGRVPQRLPARVAGRPARPELPSDLGGGPQRLHGRRRVPARGGVLPRGAAEGPGRGRDPSAARDTSSWSAARPAKPRSS